MGFTIQDIARMANVSPTTVSRVLNNKPDVKKETKEKINDLIKKYNYQPDVFAQGIHTKKSNCIGLIIPRDLEPFLSNPFYYEMLRGILTELTNRGYFLQYLHIQNKEHLANTYRQKRIDGYLLIRAGEVDESIIDSLINIEAPIVSTTDLVRNKTICSVDINNYQAASEAMIHLISLGHRKIALILTNDILPSSQERFKAYQDILKSFNIPYDESLVQKTETSFKGGYDAMEKIFEKESEYPSAVFVSADVMAIGVMHSIKSRGKKIPQDISIIGFDGIGIAEYLDPPLTTVSQSSFLKGKIAAHTLINLIESAKKRDSIIINTKLIIRKSTCQYNNKI